MSKLIQICCTLCGRDLYENQSHPRFNCTVMHTDFYEVVGKDRIAEHYCPKCFKSSVIQEEVKDFEEV